MVRHHPAGLVVTLAAFVATACEIAPTAAPAIEQRPVVHAVLNPTGSLQTIIVERTLTSLRAGTGTRPYEPIGDARVVIYGPRDDSVVATKTPGTNDGAYRVQSITVTDGSSGTAGPNVLRIRPGERYRLRVETPLGTATGSTTIPVVSQIDASRRTFNVDRDTLFFNASGVRNAAGFLLRHETRVNVAERYRIALDDPLVLPLAQTRGDPDAAVWSFSFARALVRPGLAQNFIVVAVDSNYFRYYASGADPFGDDTRGNSLTGGVGVFGSVAPVVSRTLDLTADIDSPIEGTWTADRQSVVMPTTMTLYSSPYFPGPSVSGEVSFSGNGRNAVGRFIETIGSITGSGIVVQFFDSAEPDATTASGSLINGTLVLTDSRIGERITYRKR
jgi:hypothetical protein